MSIPLEPRPLVEPTVEVEAVEGSKLDRLRKQYAAMDEGFETFPLPGYDGLLQCRYRRLEPDELVGLRGADGEEGNFNVALLLTACDQLMIKDDGEPEPLASPPVKYDLRLAEMLGFEIDAPESLIGENVLMRALKNNKLWLNIHSHEVYSWMLSGKKELSLGEA